MDTNFVLHLVQLLSKLVKGQQVYSCYTNSFVAAYFGCIKATEIERATFDAITSEENMPHIAPEVALKLLALDALIIQRTWGRGDDLEPTSLHKRCCRAFFVRNGHQGEHFGSDEAVMVLGMLPSALVTKMFALALTNLPEMGAPSLPPERERDIGVLEVISSDDDIEGMYQKTLESGACYLCQKNASSGWTYHISNDYRGYWNLWRRKSGMRTGEILFTSHPMTDSKIPPSWGWYPRPGVQLPPLFVVPHPNV